VPYTREDVLEQLREEMLAVATDAGDPAGDGEMDDATREELARLAALAGDDETLDAMVAELNAGREEVPGG
jgi:hypothetical protein